MFLLWSNVIRTFEIDEDFASRFSNIGKKFVVKKVEWLDYEVISFVDRTDSAWNLSLKVAWDKSPIQKGSLFVH